MPDALSNGLYLEQQIVEYDKNVIKPIYMDFWTTRGENHQTSGDLPIGLKEIQVTNLSEYGEATVISGRSSDFQLADVGGDSTKFNTIMIGMAVKWSDMEISQSRLANTYPIMGQVDLIPAKIQAAENKMAMKMHDLILFGSAQHGFRGWFNSPQVAETPVNPAEKPLIMTPDQLFDWIVGILDTFADKSGLSSQDLYMFVDRRLMSRLLKTVISTGSPSNSAYSQIVSSNPATAGLLKEIREIPDLKPSNLQAKMGLAANTGRIIIGAYAKSDSANRRYFAPQNTPIDRIPMTLGEMGFVRYMGTSEVMHRQPIYFQQVNYSTALV